MIRRVIVVIIAVLIAITMFAFASVNTGTIDIDLLFAEVTSSIPLAFTVAFAAGWLFGLLCASIWVFRLVRERRLLRRSLAISESEVSSLRKLPLNDAD